MCVNAWHSGRLGVLITNKSVISTLTVPYSSPLVWYAFTVKMI